MVVVFFRLVGLVVGVVVWVVVYELLVVRVRVVVWLACDW